MAVQDLANHRIQTGRCRSWWLSCVALPVLAAVCLTACSETSAPSKNASTRGNFIIVEVDGLDPGDREVLMVNTYNGDSWRLTKWTDAGGRNNIGWHPIADLTIEGSPYYKTRTGITTVTGHRR